MRRSILAVAVLAFSIAAAGASDAAICKDSKTGKIIKCPAPAAAPAGKPCRDPKTGKLMKCGSAPMSAPLASLLHHNPPAAGPSHGTVVHGGGAIVCKTGKPCGNACIPKDRQCHK
jgi:hypothetical protein